MEAKASSVEKRGAWTDEFPFPGVFVFFVFFVPFVVPFLVLFPLWSHFG